MSDVWRKFWDWRRWLSLMLALAALVLVDLDGPWWQDILAATLIIAALNMRQQMEPV